MAKNQTIIPPNTPVIMIDVDGCTAAEYARRSGLAPGTVKKMIDQARLPTFKKYLPGKTRFGSKATVLVDLVKLAQERLEENYK